MNEVKKGLKDWLTVVALWMGFGGITAHGIGLFGDYELAAGLNLALPVLCLVAFSLLATLSALAYIIYFYIDFPTANF